MGNKVNDTDCVGRTESVVLMGGTSVSCKLRVQKSYKIALLYVVLCVKKK